MSPNRYVDPDCGPGMLGVSARTVEVYNARLGLLTPAAADAFATRVAAGAAEEEADAFVTIATPCSDHDPYLWHCACCDEATSFRFCHQCGRKGIPSRGVA